MSDFTTSQGCEPSLGTQSPTAGRAKAEPGAPVLHRLLTVYGLWIAVAMLYWPSAVALNALWTQPAGEEAYSHGYLILLISLWLVFRDRRQMAAIPVRPTPRALVALLLLSGVWIWCWRAALQEPHLMLLPLLLFTAVVAALGWPVARRLAFPIGYIYFAMPVWSAINPYVQTLSAKVCGALIWITGLPAYVQGDYVHLPGGIIEIATTCSGLHELIVGLALATLYGRISGEPLGRRLKWIGVMGVLSLAVNWVRIFIVLIAAYFTDMGSSLVKQHYWLGWWLFAGVFALFLWWLGRQPPARSSDQSAAAPQPESPPRRLSFANMAATLAVLALLPALAYGTDWLRSGGSTAVEIAWPAAPAGWNGPQAVTGGDWQPVFIHADGESLTRYTNANGGSVESFAVAYRVQTQNAKLLSYWNDLLGSRRGLQSQSTRVESSPSGAWQETLAVNPAGERSIIWSRYRVGDHAFVEPRLSQLWYGLGALELRPRISSLLALRAMCVPDCKAARTLLRGAAQLRPTLR